MRLQAALRRAEEAEGRLTRGLPPPGRTRRGWYSGPEEAEGRLGEAEEMAAAAKEAAGAEVVVTVGEEARPNVNASANVDRGAAAEERALASVAARDAKKTALAEIGKLLVGDMADVKKTR